MAQAFPSESLPTYVIKTVCFDEDGNEIEAEGVCAEYDTGSPLPTFSIVKPAIENTRVDMSPYGKSIFADAIDAVQAVDLAFDAMINEVDVSKMRAFLSDVLFDKERDGKKRVSIPFGKQDCTVFRKVMSTEDAIQEFAPALRTASKVEALRISLQMLGDLCGFGITYFDFDSTGYVKTATEVSSDNSALKGGAVIVFSAQRMLEKCYNQNAKNSGRYSIWSRTCCWASICGVPSHTMESLPATAPPRSRARLAGSRLRHSKPAA